MFIADCCCKKHLDLFYERIEAEDVDAETLYCKYCGITHCTAGYGVDKDLGLLLNQETDFFICGRPLCQDVAGG